MDKDPEYIYKDLTRTIIRCFFDIHNSHLLLMVTIQMLP